VDELERSVEEVEPILLFADAITELENVI